MSTVVVEPAEQLTLIPVPAPRGKRRPGPSVERSWAREEAQAHTAYLESQVVGDAYLEARLHAEWIEILRRAPIAVARRRRSGWL